MRFMAYAFLALPLTVLAQDYVTLKDFSKQLGPARSMIELKSLNESENRLLKRLEVKPGFNSQYLLDNDVYFQTNTDAILKNSKATTLIEARKDLFRGLEFNTEEGNFKFPYPVLTHWDILPHPPIQKLDHEVSYYTDRYLPHLEINQELLSEKFNQELNELTQSDVTFGNTVTPVQNKDVFIELEKMVYNANEYVLMSTMFMTCDQSVMPLVDLMEKKIKSGVPVHFMLERGFALKYSGCLRTLKKVGVNIIYNDNLIRLKDSRVFHDKFCISDNKKAMVFGSNVLDTEAESTGFNQHFRDSGVILTGPAVTDLASEWIGLAKFLKPKKTAKFISEIEARVDQFKAIETQKGLRGLSELKNQKDLNGMCRVVIQSPHKSKTALHDLYAKLMSAAKRNVFISTVRLPEDLNDPVAAKVVKLFDDLHDHAKQDPNFHVDVITNNKIASTEVKSVNYKQTGFMVGLYKLFVKATDTVAVIKGAREHFGEKNKLPNFDIWTYFNYYHSKLLMVDNTINVIGSYNVDVISDEKSFEMAVACYDRSGTEMSQKTIALDLINSVPILE